MSWCTKPDATLEAHVLDPNKFYFCVVGNARSHLKCPFPYLCFVEEDYSLAQVVTCLLKIYTTSWKVICGGGVLALGKCMSKIISINISKMPCVKPVFEQAMASRFSNV